MLVVEISFKAIKKKKKQQPINSLLNMTGVENLQERVGVLQAGLGGWCWQVSVRLSGVSVSKIFSSIIMTNA